MRGSGWSSTHKGMGFGGQEGRGEDHKRFRFQWGGAVIQWQGAVHHGARPLAVVCMAFVCLAPLRYKTLEPYGHGDAAGPCANALAPALARELVAQPIAEVRAGNADTRAGYHVKPVVLVAVHAVDGGVGGHRIAGHSNPWRHVAVLLI